MNIEKLKRLQSQVRIGGKGTPRRKKKVIHQTAAADDKKLQSSLKKLSVSTIPGIEEVNIIKDDLTVIHFNNPKAQASLSANTFALTGHGETKKIVEMLPEILPQLGQETVVQLRMFANSMTKNQKDGVDGFEPNLLGNTDEDDVPLLVSDFDEIAKKEDLNIGQMQRPTKGLVLNADIINTCENAAVPLMDKYSNAENKATENATAFSLIEPLHTLDDNVKMEVNVKKDNTKKSGKSDNTKKTTIPGNSGTVKESNANKKEHTKPKNKVTDLQPSPSQHETVCSINEPLKASQYNENKDANVKQAVKKSTTKTTEKSNAGTTVKEVNVKKENNKPNNKVIDAAPILSQQTTADPIVEPLHTPDNVKIDANIKKDNTKKSDNNNIKKKTELGNTDILKDGDVKKESTMPKNKVSVAVTPNTSHQKNEKDINECKKLLPTNEFEKDIIKTSDELSSINIGSSSEPFTNPENVIVADSKDDQPMISNAQTNKNQIEQPKIELIDQINLINNSILLTDSNVEKLEISDEIMQQEMKNITILSLDNNKMDSNVTAASTGSSCNSEESVEKLREAAQSTCPNEELKKENIQETQDIHLSLNTLEKKKKNLTGIKDDAQPAAIVLMSLESLKEKMELDEIIPNVVITKKYDVQEVGGLASLLNLDTKINEVQDQLFDLATDSINQPEPLQTKEIQSEKMLATTLIDIEKQIKDVEIMQDPTVPLQFAQEKQSETESSAKVVESLQNIKTQSKPVKEPILESTRTMPQELGKQDINDNIKPQIHADLTAKSTIRSPPQKTNDPNTGKPQLASPMKPDSKKPDSSVRPKQVSPPKSHAQQSSTGTTPKTQQSSKLTTSSTSAKQEKSSVAPKTKQTLSTSIKSQASATASKPLTTQPKKTPVYPSSSDSFQKNSVSIKPSSAPEMSQATTPAKPRVDSNNQKGIKKSKPQSVATTVQQKISEDPPKPNQ